MRKGVAGKYVTLLVVPHEDASNPRRVRLPVWLYRGGLVFIALVVVAPIVYVAVYYEVVARALQAGRLAEENRSLRRYQNKVQALEQSLVESRQLINQILAMAGLDSTRLTELYTGADPAPPEAGAPAGFEGDSPDLPPGSPIPDGLPAAGWISRGFSDVSGTKHNGVDLAMAEGTPVRATAFGVVTFAGLDAEYGNMIVLKNNDSIETVFGHNRQNLVTVGDTVYAGERIALSGNTGASSAPHLHYEVRIKGKAINPIKYFVYEDQIK